MRGGAAAALAALVLSGGWGACPGSGDGAAKRELAARRVEHDRLLREFEALADRDPVVTEVAASPAGVLVAVRTDVVESIVQEVARRYLDRVALDLPLDVHVHESREVDVSTRFGPVNAGRWTADLTIDRVRGVLRAGRARVQPGAGNTLRLDVPVAIAEGGGSATAHFEWKGRKLGGLVCRDFEVTRRLQGRVLPEHYPVSGAVQLSAGPETLRAEPVFTHRAFHVRVDLLPASWDAIRDALDEQDQLLRCGLALKPDEILGRLRDLLRRGFDVTLPASLFRAVDLPAGVRREIEFEDRKVDLSVDTRALRITPDAIWYGADVRARTP